MQNWSPRQSLDRRPTCRPGGEEDGFNEITKGGKERTTETERQTDLAVLVGVFLHPHPGQVDL